jgi:hypothetical protein
MLKLFKCLIQLLSSVVVVMARKSKRRRVKETQQKAQEEPKKESAPAKKTREKKPAVNQNMILAVLAVVVIAVAAWYAGTLSCTGAIVADDVGSELVGSKVVDFLQSRLGAAYPGIEVELAGVEDYSNLTDTYEVNVKITYQGQTQELPYYASKDGKSLFTIIGDLDEEFEVPDQTSDTEPQDTGDLCEQLGVTKSEVPKVEVFIMSYCPYGLQMQKAVLPVMDLLGDKADITIKWVSYIMHGEKEIDENNVQECVKREFPDKYVDYATCFTVSGTSDECLAQVGIDSATIDSCIADLDAEFNISGLYADQSTWSGGSYPQYPVYAAENALYGVRGSPTTVINGKVVSINRSPEAVKQAVCCAFTDPPAECSQTLSSTAASPGIGGDAGTDTDAQC